MRFFLLLSFVPLHLAAQIEITWGIPQKQQRKTAMTGMLGADDRFMYCIRTDYALFGSSDPIIERYKQPEMSLDYSKRISHKRFDGSHLRPQVQFYVDGKILAFATWYDSGKDINFAYGEILDDHANVERSWTEVARIPADKRNNPGSFLFRLSNDSSHVLIVANPPYEKYADEKFNIHLIDAGLQKKWTREIMPPYKDQYFSLDNYIITAEGNVYILATISRDKTVMTRAERRTTPTYYHSALMYNPANDSLSEYKIQLDPKFISDIIMTVDSAGDIICSGFYSNKSSNAIIGTFYMKISKATGKAEREGTMDFSSEFLTQFMSTKRAAKKKELYDYNLRYLVQRNDGGAILVAEQYYETQVCNTDPRTGTTTCTYYYYYNDIVVVNIKPDGTIEWARKIPKLQVSRNDGGYFLSFAFAVSGNSLYFMFNDNPKNLAVVAGKGYKYMNNVTKSVAVLVNMEMNGEQTRQTMFRNRDLKTYLRPKLSLQVGEKRMFLYGQKRNTFKIASVDFGD